MQIRYGLTTKLTSAVISTSTIILAIVFIYNYILSKEILLESNSALVNIQIEKIALTIDSVVKSVEQFPESIRNAHNKGQLSIEVLRDNIPAAIDSNEKIYGSTIAFEPYAYDESVEGYAPYFYAKQGGGIAETSLATEEYDYLNQPWYTEPKMTGQPVWSEPYFDENGGNVLMVTYSVPLFRSDKFTAVVTADIALDWLQKFIRSIKVGNLGYVFIMSRDGVVLAHNDPGMIMKSFEKKNENEIVNNYLNSIIDYRSDTTDTNHVIEFDPYIQGPAILQFWQHDITGWFIGVVFSEVEMTAGIRKINRDIWMIGFAGILILIVVIFLLSHRITGPLRELANSTLLLGRGDLDAHLPQVDTRDEIGVLAHSISVMRDNLKSYINELTEVVAAREKIENELEIAYDIQMDMVPRDFPLFDDNMGVDLYAHLIPARGVGGDLYDAFNLDDESIFFTVGDVSGKGVPAALMMARTVTLIRSLAKQMTEPHMILEQASTELSRNNERCMFVTLICGVLNCRSGKMKYANAGHNFPVIVDGDGHSSLVECAVSTPLALMEDSRYETLEMDLSPDDKFVLYSDGVTEAFNIEREQFGEERLLQSASQDSTKTAEYLVEEIICDVKDYAAEAEQSDDIVVLVVRCLDTYTRSQTIKVSNNPEEYPGALALLYEFCHEHSIPNEIRGSLQLIFEESVINVMNYAYPEGVEGVIEILLKAKSDWFSITLIDSGKAFNPLQKDYNLKAEFEVRGKGGMGILLIKELTDKINYSYTDGCNRLEMWVRVN